MEVLKIEAVRWIVIALLNVVTAFAVVKLVGIVSSARSRKRRARRAAEAKHSAPPHTAIVNVISDDVAFVITEVMGFETWWAIRPVIVAYFATSGLVVIRVKDVDIAITLFGLGGLVEVLSVLGEDWRGERTRVQSLIGRVVTHDEAVEAANKVAEAVIWR